MVEIISKLLTFFVFNKNLKRKLRDKIKTFYFGFKVITKAKKIGKNFVCEGYSIASKTTTIGNNVRINSTKMRGFGEIKIGNYVQMGENILIISENHNYDHGQQIPYDRSMILKDVEIGDFAWIGSNVTILPGAKIGEGAIIQAGSVVRGEIEACAIAGGNPAKVFKYRDIEHFNNLKEKGCFLKYYE